MGKQFPDRDLRQLSGGIQIEGRHRLPVSANPAPNACPRRIRGKSVYVPDDTRVLNPGRTSVRLAAAVSVPVVKRKLSSICEELPEGDRSAVMGN